MSTTEPDIDWDSFEQNWNDKSLTQFLGSLAYVPQYVQIGHSPKPSRTLKSFRVKLTCVILHMNISYFLNYRVILILKHLICVILTLISKVINGLL